MREPPGESILLARVVRGEEARKAAGQLMNCSVREGIRSMSRDKAVLFENLEVGAKSDAAENENCFRLDDAQLGFKIWAAILEFRR